MTEKDKIIDVETIDYVFNNMEYDWSEIKCRWEIKETTNTWWEKEIKKAFNLGIQSQKQKIIKEIKNWWNKQSDGDIDKHDVGYVKIYWDDIEELLKSINSQDVKLIDKVSPEDKAKVNVIATASLGDVSGCPDKTLGEIQQ